MLCVHAKILVELHKCQVYDIFGDESGISGTLGRVEEFDSNKDDWQQYVERLEHFFVANGI